MVLAANTAEAFWIGAGAFLVLCVLVFLFTPRDVNGRKRATGCAVGLAIFFALFVGAFAAWAANHIF